MTRFKVLRKFIIFFFFFNTKTEEVHHINNATYWSQVFIWGKDSHSLLLCGLLIHHHEKTQQNKAGFPFFLCALFYIYFYILYLLATALNLHLCFLMMFKTQMEGRKWTALRRYYQGTDSMSCKAVGWSKKQPVELGSLGLFRSPKYWSVH